MSDCTCETWDGQADCGCRCCLDHDSVQEEIRKLQTTVAVMHVHLATMEDRAIKAERALSSSPPPGTPPDEVALERAKAHAQVAMTVARLGGEVEGAPTHAGNYLQRIDALRAIEARAAPPPGGERALREALHEAVEALDDLTDVQNGPPLISYTAAWDAAMSRALSAIQQGRALAAAPAQDTKEMP